ncbi:hypothetical protein P3T35_006577 [Kitasatospora sp. GP30]|nr:hypothetical protein [Kitasatospora sp. GP30]
MAAVARRSSLVARRSSRVGRRAETGSAGRAGAMVPVSRPGGLMSTAIGNEAPPETPPETQGLDDVAVVLGGVIPDEDRPALLAAGVGAVFGPGTPLPVIAEGIRDAVHRRW